MFNQLCEFMWMWRVSRELTDDFSMIAFYDAQIADLSSQLPAALEHDRKVLETLRSHALAKFSDLPIQCPFSLS